MSFVSIRKSSVFLFSLLTIFGSELLQAQPATPRQETWVTNGWVSALKQVGDILYVGGNFSYIGPNTGGWVPVDATTGAPKNAYPKVDGAVYANAPDGSGGWFIAGFFTQAGDQARNNIAHILANGSIDPAWNPGVEGLVEEMAISGSTLYIVGSFTSVDGQTRNNIAAVDVATGAVTPWDPDASAIVRTIAISGSNVYVGGQFFNIGGVTRRNIAALDLVSGVATPWNPNVNGANTSVYDIVVADSTVYVGGFFSSIGGQSRNHIAAIDIATGNATDWNPGADHRINDLAVSANAIYAGGVFSNIGGEARSGLAAIDPITGLATDWVPEGVGSSFSIELNGSLVYVGTGAVGGPGGASLFGAVAIDASTAILAPWNPDAGGLIYTFGFDGDTIFVGGNYISMGGVQRTDIAAVNVASGIATEFAASISGPASEVTAIDANDTTVYIGGKFVNVDNQVKNGLAALDATTGNLIDWGPSPNNRIYDLEIVGSVLYVAGSFTFMGGANRPMIAVIDINTGNLTDWGVTPQLPTGLNPDGLVTSMVFNGTSVFLGGQFGFVSGEARGNIAAADINTGLLLDWNPGADKTVNALAISGSTIYAGGSFTTIGGQSRNRLAAIDTSSGAASAWDPDPDNRVFELAVDGSSVYVGGSFTTIGGQARTAIAAIDASTGLANSWNPQPNLRSSVGASVGAIISSSPRLHIGGRFSSISGGTRSNLAIYDDVTPVPLPNLIFGGCSGSFEEPLCGQ